MFFVHRMTRGLGHGPASSEARRSSMVGEGLHRPWQGARSRVFMLLADRNEDEHRCARRCSLLPRLVSLDRERVRR
jgi:hypothetical protein